MVSDILVKLRCQLCFALTVVSFPILICLSLIRYILRSLFAKRKNIAGETALITGGGNGLGKEIAIRLAAEGCHIAVVDINLEAAKATASEIRQTYQVQAEAYKVDVTELEEVKALAKIVEQQLGPVTILVNNAGMLMFSTSIDTPPTDIYRMINTNLTASLWTIQVFLNTMKQLRKGHIVAISSTAGVMLCHRQLVYTATKHAIRGLMMALRTELYALSSEFINTTTVFPFFLNTNVKVKTMIEKCGLTTKIYPPLDSAEVADAVVQGILRNEMEVFVPRFTELAYKLFEFLPKTWYMMFLNEVIGRESLNKVDY